MKNFSVIFAVLTSLIFAVDLKSVPNNSLINSLISYSTYEHTLVKEEIEKKGMPFNWKFCPFSNFPIEKGQGTYFGNVNKLISYIVQIEDKFYVGITFNFESDTIYYKIVSYKIVSIQDSLIQWKRMQDYINIAERK